MMQKYVAVRGLVESIWDLNHANHFNDLVSLEIPKFAKDSSNNK